MQLSSKYFSFDEILLFILNTYNIKALVLISKDDFKLIFKQLLTELNVQGHVNYFTFYILEAYEVETLVFNTERVRREFKKLKKTFKCFQMIKKQLIIEQFFHEYTLIEMKVKKKIVLIKNISKLFFSPVCLLKSKTIIII